MGWRPSSSAGFADVLHPAAWITSPKESVKIEDDYALVEFTATGMVRGAEASGFSVAEDGVNTRMWEDPRLASAPGAIGTQTVVADNGASPPWRVWMRPRALEEARIARRDAPRLKNIRR